MLQAQARACLRRLGAVRHASSSSSSSPVVLEQHGRVMQIRLNRPKVLNAMTAELGDAFAAAVEEVAAMGTDVGAVVVTGAGKAFSAGGDLDFLRARHHDTPSRNAPIMRRFYQRFLSVRDLPVPVIAAINGPAVGAGLCFALACDVRIAAPTAKLGLTFVGLGLHPGMGATHFLPSIAGPQVAAEMMLTGKLITGEEAAARGVVAAAVEEPLAAAMEMAAQMAGASPVAVRTCVRSLRFQQEAGLEAALWREADAQAQCYASADLLEGVNAVAEKRRPNFTQYENSFEE